MSLRRLTTDYKKKLDKFYGTRKWRKIYRKRINAKDGASKLLEFYVQNIESLGFKVLKKPIRKDIRKGQRLYSLIFASRNLRAVKIMSDIFNKQLDGQLNLLKNGL